MPNYKVHVDLGNNTDKIHAIEVYIEAPSILIAGNMAVEALCSGIIVEDANVNKIVEIDSRPKVNEKDSVHQCGYFMSVVPPLRYSCANLHKEFRRSNPDIFTN